MKTLLRDSETKRRVINNGDKFYEVKFGAMMGRRKFLNVLVNDHVSGFSPANSKRKEKCYFLTERTKFLINSTKISTCFPERAAIIQFRRDTEAPNCPLHWLDTSFTNRAKKKWHLDRSQRVWETRATFFSNNFSIKRPNHFSNE